MSDQAKKKRPRGRPTVYERATKIRFVPGTAAEIALLVQRYKSHDIKHSWLKTKPGLIREALRRGLESIRAQLDEESGPQQVTLFGSQEP